MSVSPRARFLAYVLAHMGAPYRWAAKGECDTRTGQHLFDCSGLVTAALRHVGGQDLRATHNTDRIWADFKPVSADELLPGDIVLYHRRGAPMDAEHVMVHVGAGVVVGASGGGSSTLTLEDAERAGARVKAFATFHYRQGLMGFRRLPLAE
ncbi:NlpC/P60 family protein [Myxococcus landrumensis]|uniref:C40 family peptidase n=1 Tax=Myxococcus landrumensis TaxID=2813577 RepID=A0ABX7NIK8_9BACT|nr:NlpC/P60 family protein [Myxococcus landrumus]QSQ17221.1 C40 family peptidase [Myxococcus landrumus]